MAAINFRLALWELNDVAVGSKSYFVVLTKSLLSMIFVWKFCWWVGPESTSSSHLLLFLTYFTRFIIIMMGHGTLKCFEHKQLVAFWVVSPFCPLVLDYFDGSTTFILQGRRMHTQNGWSIWRPSLNRQTLLFPSDTSSFYTQWMEHFLDLSLLFVCFHFWVYWLICLSFSS